MLRPDSIASPAPARTFTTELAPEMSPPLVVGYDYAGFSQFLRPDFHWLDSRPYGLRAEKTKAVMHACDQVKAIKTHNPFAVNDIYFCDQTGVKPEAMNHYGSSLIFGHPQGPTGMRLVIELIEELAMTGGGYGLFTGCAAGDTSMACVVKIG